jgi:RNA polymerase sigma-70 factor (ECF subfamily)
VTGRLRAAFIQKFPGTPAHHGAITKQMAATARDLASDATDDDLMRRTAQGDRGAFETLYRRHHAAVYRFARLMTGSAILAEDVVQEVFLVLMRNAKQYDAARATLSTYLYGVARRQTRRRLARERRFVGLEEHARVQLMPATAQADEIERRDELLQLRRAIVSLPSRYREVLVLCDLHDISYAEAAATVGCAVGTVRSRLHRARQLLGNKMRRAAAANPCVASASLRCAV